MSSEGVAIPGCIATTQRMALQSQAQFLLIVEKDAIFQACMRSCGGLVVGCGWGCWQGIETEERREWTWAELDGRHQVGMKHHVQYSSTICTRSPSPGLPPQTDSCPRSNWWLRTSGASAPASY